MGSNAGFRTQELTQRRFREAVASTVTTQHQLLGDVAAKVASHDQELRDLERDVEMFQARGFWSRVNWLVRGR